MSLMEVETTYSSPRTVVADAYEIDDAGNLILSIKQGIVAVFAAGRWVSFEAKPLRGPDGRFVKRGDVWFVKRGDV